MFKKLVHQSLHSLGYKISRSPVLSPSPSPVSARLAADTTWDLWQRLSKEHQIALAPSLPYLHSQYSQDFFVLCCQLAANIPRVFVEAGATDGLQWSNTFVLEKHHNWSGVLVEPCRSYAEVLPLNRSSRVDLRCLTSSNLSSVMFREVCSSTSEFPLSSPELSCIDESQPSDWASEIRSNNFIKYSVNTVCFNALMVDQCMPSHIGYLSLDTEGTELKILSEIDFSKYTIDVLTVEHNFRPDDMSSLRALMSTSGYSLVLDHLSMGDYWFVRNAIRDQLYFVDNAQ